MAVSFEDVELLQDVAAVVDDPDVRAEAATDIEDVVTGIISQRLGILDFRGQMDDREDLRARVVDLDDRICRWAWNLIAVRNEQVAVVRIDRDILRVVAAQRL